MGPNFEKHTCKTARRTHLPSIPVTKPTAASLLGPSPRGRLTIACAFIRWSWLAGWVRVAVGVWGRSGTLG